MANKVDLTGNRFGRLIVLEHIGYKCFPSGGRHLLWKCKCDCGNFTNVTTEKLKSCSTRSCGCLAREIRSKRKGQNATNYKNGITFTRLGYIYLGIKQRCYNPNNQNYHNYGGRGITMCDEWLGEHGFENFRNWCIKNGFKEKSNRGECTIDRIDVNGNYEPSNCRWVDITVQARNRRDCVYIEYMGERKTISEWSEITGIKDSTIRNRLNRGWDIDKALSVKSRKYIKKNSL